MLQFVKRRLPARGWKRWAAIGGLLVTLGFVGLVALVLTAYLTFRTAAFQSFFIQKIIVFASPDYPDNSRKAKAPVPNYKGPEARLESIKSADEFYRPTNIWNIHLLFGQDQWKKLQPIRIPAMHIFGSTNLSLHNPAASRSGLAGTLGFDFPWSTGTVEIGGQVFPNSGVRYKGNGTFFSAGSGYKKPFKVDIHKHNKEMKVAGRSSLNLANLAADATCISDTMAYEFFRQAGVPAPRTAFGRVFLTAAGEVEHRLLGPYVLVENIDSEWAADVLGDKSTPIFKPVTHELFNYLGTDWKAYETIYDPKGKIGTNETERIIRLCKLVTQGTDEEFAKSIGDLIDLDEFAKYLACEVTVANYDGILTTGQNFYMYMDPKSRKLGFVPWDQDQAWGEFGMVGSLEARERLDIMHPWQGQNRFLERMMKAEGFVSRYKAEFDRLLKTLFVPERLAKRADELAAIVTPLVSEQSTNRLRKFTVALSGTPLPRPAKANPFGGNQSPHQMKVFIPAHAKSIRDQLDGTAKGLRLQENR